jgi:acetyl-CoA acetyltransferase
VPGQTPPRAVRDVVFVDGVRTPFGKAGPKGMYAETRADDMVIRCIRELVRRGLIERRSDPSPSRCAQRRSRGNVLPVRR